MCKRSGKLTSHTRRVDRSEQAGIVAIGNRIVRNGKANGLGGNMRQVVFARRCPWQETTATHARDEKNVPLVPIPGRSRNKP